MFRQFALRSFLLESVNALKYRPSLLQTDLIFAAQAAEGIRDQEALFDSCSQMEKDASSHR